MNILLRITENLVVGHRIRLVREMFCKCLQGCKIGHFSYKIEASDGPSFACNSVKQVMKGTTSAAAWTSKIVYLLCCSASLFSIAIFRICVILEVMNSPLGVGPETMVKTHLTKKATGKNWTC